MVEPSSLEKLKAAYAAGNIAESIRIAAGFKHLGTQRDAIQRAWSAMRNPEFYQDIGVSVDSAIQAAVAAMVERFDL